MAQAGTRNLTLTVDDVDQTPNVSKVVMVNASEDADFLSFAAAAGTSSGVQALQITYAQDLAVGSLHRMTIDNAGDEIPFRLRVYGNTTATAAQPHVVGTCIVSRPDGDWIGGEADSSKTARLTNEVEWEITSWELDDGA